MSPEQTAVLMFVALVVTLAALVYLIDGALYRPERGDIARQREALAQIREDIGRRYIASIDTQEGTA